ncbi:30S ribosomal protein S9 [Candidatus Woesearchaeota archaeon]|nr:30S ribosomal protein S9 [Candidatus Woesearchaeota archaeon]MBW3021307.1 30S ribosomal protein S9 [Candidatus Woesearchaeota archaeon]
MKVVHTSGKRKYAIARATLKPGNGKVKINGVLLDVYGNELSRAKLMEPLILADKHSAKVDINVKVTGGGFMSQAEAARLAIARALIQFAKSEKLKQQFLEYDRNLLVADTRRREPCKPNDSRARAKRQKSYR